jgi:mono/diheme cytochrome c family protein
MGITRSVVRWTLMVAGCVALATGCGDDPVPPDAAVLRDATVKDAPGADAAIDGSVGDAHAIDGGAVADGGADGAASDAPVTDAAVTDGPVVEGGSVDGPTLTPQQLRGQYLIDAVNACGDCHTPRLPSGAPDFSKYLSGVECFAKLPNNDCLNTRNLTNDVSGLLNRSDDDIKNMFLNGMRPDPAGAVALNPVMPYYVFHNMRADDASAIVAYLRTVRAVAHTVPRSGASFDVPAPAPPVDPGTIPLPMAGFAELESATRGRYLAAEMGVCMECHTKHNPPGSPTVLDPTRYFQGGEEYQVGLPVVPVSKNLTSDSATGLGDWSAADIVKVLTMGLDRDGKGICPPMPVGPTGPFGHLTPGDAMDIANYIKSLPPAVNMIVDMCSLPLPPPPDAGSDSAPGPDATTD